VQYVACNSFPANKACDFYTHTQLFAKKTALDHSEAANKDDETPRTYFGTY